MADILIVEDARLQKALIQQFVRPEHTVVGIVETEKSAVTFITRHEPDVAIVDIDLAEGNGIMVANRIASSDLDTRVIISTALVNESSNTLAQRTSVDAYLVKPYSKREVLDAIENCASSRE